MYRKHEITTFSNIQKGKTWLIFNWYLLRTLHYILSKFIWKFKTIYKLDIYFLEWIFVFPFIKNELNFKSNTTVANLRQHQNYSRTRCWNLLHQINQRKRGCCSSISIYKNNWVTLAMMLIFPIQTFIKMFNKKGSMHGLESNTHLKRAYYRGEAKRQIQWELSWCFQL